MPNKIPVAKPDLSGNELKYLINCIKDGWVSSIGTYISKFENLFTKLTNCKYAISTSNGTSALHLSLLGLNIKKGDEIIVPDLTFVATANAVSYTGAKPVFVDSTPEYWNIDPGKIEENITKNTKAILVVHLYGHPANTDQIEKIAKKYKLFVIEDAAEAHGAFYKNRPVGSLGTISCFSFYGNKIITTGEGGMITTNNKSLATRISFLKDHAMSAKKRYYHSIIGYNYRMTNLQAAVGLAQLEKIDSFTSKKRYNAALYNSLLKDLNDYVTLPPEMPWAQSSYWMYSIVLKPTGNYTRNKLMSYLRKKGIDTRPFFIPMHLLPMYRQKGDFKISTLLSKNGINLPSSTLLSEKDIYYISKMIKMFFEKK